MADDKRRTIRIESILGGHSLLTHFSSDDQFRSSLGIDPAQPIDDSATGYSANGSGLLRPAVGYSYSGTTFFRQPGDANEARTPYWIKDSPKTTAVFVYDSGGSIYTSKSEFTTSPTSLSDGGSMFSASGNGCAYYDNYMYFAKNTTIARYGPLSTSDTVFDGDYWGTTLGKTALSDTNYPYDNSTGVVYPNHVLHRHSDGRLYIADVVDNKGTIHFIQTTKTSVEGDTDNGSTYNKIQVGYGLHPTAIESYGNDLAVSFFELRADAGSPVVNASSRAKIAFWDTASQNVNKITWVEFPDPMITAMKNVNGVLYVVSGNNTSDGFRITRFVGGYTFEEVYYSEAGVIPLAGAIDGNARRLLFGSNTTVPERSACVFSYGLQKSGIGQGLFNVMSVGGTTYAQFTTATALLLDSSRAFSFNVPFVGWSEGNGDAYAGGIDVQSAIYNQNVSTWWSQLYRIGQSFKITKVRIPLAQDVSANMTVTPYIWTDDGDGTKYMLTDITVGNDSGSRNIIRRSDASGNTILGQHNFWLELRWTGSALCTVGLPITIEYELLDD